MGLTKTENFTQEQNALASVAKVIGHPARIAILEHIIKSQSCVCGSIVDEIGLAQSTISQHLAELKRVGLIQGTIEGTSVCYCVNVETWESFKNQFNTLFDSAIKGIECC
ncbi:MAG: metalloregulator ArsR/SmtB family transcription factor [Flavobacteriales bacterium]